MRPLKFTFRIIFVALATVLLGAMAWACRVQILAALPPAQPAAAPPIVFDNGSVREPRTVDAGSTPVMPEGVARKCVGAKDILYTDRESPQGYTEAKIEPGRVTVLAGSGAAKPAPAAEPAQERRKSLYDVLERRP